MKAIITKKKEERTKKKNSLIFPNIEEYEDGIFGQRKKKIQKEKEKPEKEEFIITLRSVRDEVPDVKIPISQLEDYLNGKVDKEVRVIPFKGKEEPTIKLCFLRDELPDLIVPISQLEDYL